MAAAYVSHVKGTETSKSILVESGTSLLVVTIIATNAGFGTPRTVTYGGVTLNAATTSNQFVQIHYMLNPPVGTATRTVSGDEIDWIVDGHYSGVNAFQAASEAASSNRSFNMLGPGLVVFGQESESETHDPRASTTEREDSDKNFYGDAIATTFGFFNVGTLTAVEPHSAAAAFLEPFPTVSVSGTAEAPGPIRSGSVTVAVSVSASTSNAPRATPTGSVVASLAAAGTQSAPLASASGSATLGVQVISSATALAPTVSGDVILFGTARPHAFIARTPRPRASVRED